MNCIKLAIRHFLACGLHYIGTVSCRMVTLRWKNPE